MKNIGIGVVTCGIRKLNGNILKYNPVIFEDKERKGAAYCRNMLIKQFYDEGRITYSCLMMTVILVFMVGRKELLIGHQRIMFIISQALTQRTQTY